MENSRLNTLSWLAEQYEPLDRETERELLIKFKEGSDKEALDAKEKLILHNSRFIMWVVNQFNIRDRNLRLEAESSAMAGFIRALHRFDLSHNTRLTTYAYYWTFVETWDTLVQARTAHTIPKYIYKAVARFWKGKPHSTDDETSEFITSKLNVDSNTAEFIINSCKYGMINFTDLLSEDDDDDGKSTEFSKSAFGDPTDMQVRVQLRELADQVEGYCKSNLTKKQNQVVAMIVIPYLRDREVVTIQEAARRLLCHYQAVDQRLQYIGTRLSQSVEGRRIYRIISKVVEAIKNGKRD